MDREPWLKKQIFQLLNFLKPAAIAFALVLLLQVTGLMSSASYLSQRALLATGLKDASTAKVGKEEDFDFNFTVKDLKGNKLPFDQFKGKVIFLNMWATWCGPCRAEMPGIQNLYSKVNKDKITFIMLSIDKDGDKGKIVDYLEKRAFTFPAYQPSGYLTEQLQIPSIPTTFVISKEGKIVMKEVGSMSYDTPKFQKFLEELSR